MWAQFDKCAVIAIVMVFSASNLFCAQRRRANFLDSAPGSVGLALGGALTAKGIDTSAVYYNPATLLSQHSGALIEYAQPNVGATRSWLGVSTGGDRYSFGFLWKNESLPLSSSRNAFLMSTAISDKSIPLVPKGVSLGFTLGYIQENILGYSASSLLGSLGGAYSRAIRSTEFGIGMVIRNIYFSGLQFRPEGEKEVWPVEPEIGAYVSKWGFKLLTSIKGQNAGDAQYGFGLAYQPVSFIELRVGVDGYPRMGVGCEVKKIRVDYAMILGEIQNINSMTISYLWGKPEKEKDYTNPLTELSTRYETLPEYILAELRNTAQSGEIPELHDVFRLLAVDPMNEDGWSLYTSLTGAKRLNIKIPFRKKVKRQYLEFAIAYANNSSGSLELAERFMEKYPNAKITELIRLILKGEK